MERTASRPIELAFYGGTFTALPERLQMECLALAMQAKEKGIVCRVRCSTRPDTLRPDRLQALRHAGLDLVELGIQSFHTEALLEVQRGYNGDTAREGCRLIKESGLKLGIQLLPGMPGSTPQRFSEDVEEALAFSPSCLRFYPVSSWTVQAALGTVEDGPICALGTGHDHNHPWESSCLCMGTENPRHPFEPRPGA